MGTCVTLEFKISGHQRAERQTTDTHRSHKQPSQQIRTYMKKVYKSVKTNKKGGAGRGQVKGKSLNRLFTDGETPRDHRQALRWFAWQTTGRCQLAAHGFQLCRVHSEHILHQESIRPPGGSVVKNLPAMQETQF